ncbi:MAG: ribonuclease HII [Candidatus Harrisonbacteria bacterium]|nr:ribonuclease HII [Candidatus Harrisonbacteria bacterium]
MNRYLIGIDEVGRGCLAGPVTVAAVAIPADSKFRKLKDSKKLSARRRKEWFGFIKTQPNIFYKIARVYPKIIDKKNISQAANLAATRAFQKLAAELDLSAGKTKVFLDGGLYINKILDSRYQILDIRTVVKGDEKYNCVKLASIAAKVHRDGIMIRHHKKFPVYGFADHKGYGTKIHVLALKKYGPCSLHRLTFIKKFV